MKRDVIVYRTKDNKEPFLDWLFSLRDKVTRQRIEKRVERIHQNNFGNHKRFSGVVELRLDFGKGYRIYCAEDGHLLIVLLAGGDKSTQENDILSALKYLEDYHGQKKI